MAMNSKATPIAYAPSFKEDSFQKAELVKKDDNDVKRKKYCPIFDGKGGIEALLYVQEEFVSKRPSKDDKSKSESNKKHAKRYDYDYKVGDAVLVKEVDPVKLQPRAHGPYSIVQVHTNGTIEIQRNPGVRERINIRRVVPFKA